MDGGRRSSVTSSISSAAPSAARSASLRAPCVTCCLSSAIDWVRACGRGTVYTFTVTYQNQAPGFRESLPYVLAVVQFDEGAELMTNVVGCAPDDVRIGMPVHIVFDDVTPEITLAKFKPA